MKNIVIVMGVCGAGKTTVGRQLADALGVPFYDADDFHSAGNVAKMKSGQALNEQDREPWLSSLNKLLSKQTNGAVLACSALKNSHREILSQDLTDRIELVFLSAPHDVLAERMAQRKGHYMPASLLRTQFDALEEPDESMHINACNSVETIVSEIRTRMS